MLGRSHTDAESKGVEVTAGQSPQQGPFHSNPNGTVTVVRRGQANSFPKENKSIARLQSIAAAKFDGASSLRLQEA